MKYFSFLILLFLSCNESVEKITHDSKLQSLLWLQHSVEYDAISYQMYQNAELCLNTALTDVHWKAVPDEEIHTKPPALIVYIDEVIVKSSSYNVGLLKSQLKASDKTWNNWVNQISAEKIKGSVFFLKKAHAKGIKIFYLTRRNRLVLETTRLNLRNLGFPLEDEFETILTPKKIDITGKLRRNLIAKNYRVLMILGHDLSHFSEEFFELEIVDRRSLVKKYREKFGREWFLMPNPLYGSWNDALYYFDYQVGEKEKQERKIELLDY